MGRALESSPIERPWIGALTGLLPFAAITTTLLMARLVAVACRSPVRGGAMGVSARPTGQRQDVRASRS